MLVHVGHPHSLPLKVNVYLRPARPSFEMFKKELARRGIPPPSSIHVDWFGGKCLEQPWLEQFPKSRFICGAERMIRAIVRNDRQGGL